MRSPLAVKLYRGDWPVLDLHFGPWTIRYSLRRGLARFGNGSRWHSGWHRWDGRMSDAFRKGLIEQESGFHEFNRKEYVVSSGKYSIREDPNHRGEWEILDFGTAVLGWLTPHQAARILAILVEHTYDPPRSGILGERGCQTCGDAPLEHTS